MKVLSVLHVVLLIVAFTATPVLLLASSASADEQQGSQTPSRHENVWTPEFPQQLPASAVDVAHSATSTGSGWSTTIALFGDISSPAFFSFYGEVSIGRPPQRFKMLFETIESSLWIPNYKIPASQHAFYDHSKSSSYVADGKGCISGLAYYTYVGFQSRDYVNIGDFGLRSVAFVEATDVKSKANFADSAVDGMLGLAPNLERNPVLKTLMDSGTLESRAFTFYFAKSTESTKRDLDKSYVGEISIGAIDKDRYSGDIHYVDSASKSWTIDLDAVTVGSNSSVQFTSTGSPAHAQIWPSWPFISGPPDEIKKLAEAVGVEGDAIDCSSTGPDIVIHFGDAEFALTKVEYTRRVDATRCRWVFDSIGVDGIWWIGQPFLQKFYSVFEFGANATAPRVGFALTT